MHVIRGVAVLAAAKVAGCAAVGAAEGPAMKLEAFDLRDVHLGDGPCRAAQEANRKYLHALDADRLLRNFRLTAGLPAPGEPLGGWEKPDCEVRGHFVGHYLTACALMYRSAGDDALKQKAEAMVAELAKCQKALGGDYLSAFPETFWDRVEAGQSVWAPYYTIHKIMAGLLDVHRLCGSAQALEVLKGMARYFDRRTARLSVPHMDQVLTVEFGGMSEVLHDLYGITRDPAHLALAHRFDRASFLGPLALEHDNLTRIHANTHIPEICGAARRYELTGDPRYRTIAEYFWDRVAHTRSYATGGSNESEFWGEPGKLAGTLTDKTQECCTTYNMLKVTRHLVRWTADPRYADYYERNYFNGILGTQHPGTGMLMYFVPLATGHTKTFGTPNDAFWCCYGTGIESFSKLGDSVYFHDAGGLYVNLFVASTVTWADRGVSIEQATRFPEEEGTTLVVHAKKPAAFTLHLRIPWWATRGAQVLVNGKAAEGRAKPSSYFPVQREWKDGDKVEVRLPMGLWAEPMPDDPDLVAVLYGPLLLAGLGADASPLVADAAAPAAWVKPVEGKPLTFRTEGVGRDLTLVPLYRVLDEPYGVYWLAVKEGSARHREILAEAEAARRREARVVDRVVASDAASEKDHNLQGEGTASGAAFGRGWRHATGGGWWTWDLRVPRDAAWTLACTYWGSDVPPRTFDILLDGAKIATQSLDRGRPGKFLTVEYPVPADLVRGKDRVTVKFVPHEKNTAGGVFECAVLKPEP